MQTFMPLPSFVLSAKALDYRRLGKQRVEAYQILMILLEKTEKKGWRSHPAVRMWRGHEMLLVEYIFDICREWTERGYKDTVTEKTLALVKDDPRYYDPGEVWKMPDWFNSPEFHRSHQSNLIRKDHDFYAPQFPGVPGDLPYIWPV